MKKQTKQASKKSSSRAAVEPVGARSLSAELESKVAVADPVSLDLSEIPEDPATSEQEIADRAGGPDVSVKMKDLDPEREARTQGLLRQSIQSSVRPIRIRLLPQVYDPFPMDGSTRNYNSLTGDTVTIECRTVEAANWVRAELRRLCLEMDGVKLVVEERGERGERR